MKYYPVKFTYRELRCITTVWVIPIYAGKHGSVLTFKSIDGLEYCPLVSFQSIFDWINYHFCKYPDHFLSHGLLCGRCVVLRRSLRSIVAETHHDISLGKYRDY